MLGVTTGILFGMIGLSVPIAAVLGLLALILAQIYSPMPLYRAMGDLFWTNSIDFILIAVPLFILMGEILLRSGIASRMYRALAQWLSWLPGGLMHSNIGASTLFAATSGSSIATAATIGTVALPEARRDGYHEPLFMGTLAAGGTLGILIPPSINMIIYGLLTNSSVPKLYLAGFVPGLLLAGLFGLTVLLACLARPGWGGREVKTSWKGRIAALPDLLPPLGIFLVVVGSIYAGLATPTEAASLGVVAALLLAAGNRTLTLAMLIAAIEGTMRTTAMVMLIVLAAMFLNFVLSVIGLTALLANAIEGLGLSPMQIMLVIVAGFLVLGCFMEAMSLLLIATPLVAPIVAGLGYDLVWFGILMMLLLETALITPPIGVNLYVIQGVRGTGSMNDVIRGAVPFVIALLVMIGLLLAFPQIALWMPQKFG
ncbi:TRAP transporter large permease [uncultured Paracoccus sp.]|uniref:TRAP transporter large permease n=1 Tax=uncultured Paracoccus sp. TaxID=189685 RepID=UPI0026271D24|nr:TRAP transporter large permease [uncultured Paracoccus sp.]|tara:strand:+ start:823 stop:2106 length:1284 start_codon:yes stop_codon:yes gene_type:complete